MSIKQNTRGFDQDDWMDPLYLNELLTEEEKSIRKTTRDYCKSNLLPKVIENNKKCFFDKKIYQEFGSLGFLGITITGYGAANASNVAYGLVAKEFESIDSSYRSSISVQSALVIHPIFYFGSDEQKKNYLPELINGNLVGCFGLTESISGSDPASMKTNFIEVSDGYIINGTKNWITNAPIADVFVIWALNKEKKVHGFIVDCKTQGLTTSMIEKGSSTNNVLNRYYKAAVYYRVKNIVRICSDSPLIDPKIINKVYFFYLKNNYDYVSNKIFPSYPIGMGVDILNFQSLKKANNLAKNSFEKEYVTVYIKNRPKKFKIKNIGLKKKLLSYRVVLDYAEDFNLISNMLKYFTKQRKDFSLKDIVKYIDRNPILKKINSQNLTKYGYL